MPECRLHSLQGAAAYGSGHGRSGRTLRARHFLRRTEDRPGQAARLQGQGGRQAHRRPCLDGEDAQGHCCSGKRNFFRGKLHSSRRQNHHLCQRHHCGRFAGRQATVPPGRSAHRGFDRRAGAAQPAEKASHHRRRHHRPGDGHGLFNAGRAPGRGGDAGWPDARGRPGPGLGLAEIQCLALRSRDAQDEDHEGGGDEGGHQGFIRPGRAGPLRHDSRLGRPHAEWQEDRR